VGGRVQEGQGPQGAQEDVQWDHGLPAAGVQGGREGRRKGTVEFHTEESWLPQRTSWLPDRGQPGLQDERCDLLLFQTAYYFGPGRAGLEGRGSL